MNRRLALGDSGFRRSRASKVASAMAGVIVMASLAACGSSASDPTAASTDAATACEQMIGLEDAVLNHKVSTTVALQTLAAAKVNADKAAANDPRWKRLDGDVRVMRSDLLNNQGATLKAKATDLAEICSPLATSSP